MVAESPFQSYLVALLIIIIVLLILVFLLWNRLRQQQSQPPSAPEGPIRHFLPEQLNLLANHAPGLSAQRIAELVRKNSIFEDTQLQRAIVSPERVVTFESDQQAFSLVFVDLPGVRDEGELLRLINRINDRISPTDQPKRPPRYEQTGEQSRSTTRILGESSSGANQSDELSLSVATPNWLSGGSPQHDGSGGPGAKPVPPAAVPIRSTSGLQPWQFEMPSNLVFKKPLEERGEGLDVYILDTAPCDVDLDRAYKRWGQSNQNELLASLLGPNSPFDINYAGYAHLLQLVNYFLPDHDYVMSDHGLFIAGIIHAIAPKAKLHLIEVLNPYGVGTLESIARGFAIAASQLTTHPRLLVNASLMLKVAPPDLESIELLSQRDPFWKAFPLDQIDQTVEPLKRICDFLARHLSGVVAAAGNDGDKKVHPAARFPAAFQGVLGVGALNRDSTPAIYSNISDTPNSAGIATYGGDSGGKLADPTNGILGVFTGVFPDGSPNQAGWARWAGTSFATPIISGTIAALMSEDNPSAPGQKYSLDEAIQLLRNAYTGPPNAGPIGEIFPVTQG